MVMAIIIFHGPCHFPRLLLRRHESTQIDIVTGNSNSWRGLPLVLTEIMRSHSHKTVIRPSTLTADGDDYDYAYDYGMRHGYDYEFRTRLRLGSPQPQSQPKTVNVTIIGRHGRLHCRRN